jgi:hypothetical protein
LSKLPDVKITAEMVKAAAREKFRKPASKKEETEPKRHQIPVSEAATRAGHLIFELDSSLATAAEAATRRKASKLIDKLDHR